MDIGELTNVVHARRARHTVPRITSPHRCGDGSALRIEDWRRDRFTNDGGERVVFDLATGLPPLREAASSRAGSVGEWRTFPVERYGSP